MKRYKCTYSYRGMETEGRLETFPTQIIEANDKAEAMYLYLQWIDKEVNKNRYKGVLDLYPTLEDYKKSEYAEGGWGFRAEEL